MNTTGYTPSHSAPRTPPAPAVLTRDQVAVLATEVRTLRERLIILRAREAALQQKVRQQAHEIEKYNNTLCALLEELRKNQNLTLSYPHHVGEILVQQGRGLLEKFATGDAVSRFKLRLRIGEFLDFEGTLSEAAYSHPEWPQVRDELQRIGRQRWYQHVIEREALQRTAVRLLRRLKLLPR